MEQDLEDLKAGRITFEQFEKNLNDPAIKQVERTKRQILGGGRYTNRTNQTLLPDDFKFR